MHIVLKGQPQLKGVHVTSIGSTTPDSLQVRIQTWPWRSLTSGLWTDHEPLLTYASCFICIFEIQIWKHYEKQHMLYKWKALVLLLIPFSELIEIQMSFLSYLLLPQYCIWVDNSGLQFLWLYRNLAVQVKVIWCGAFSFSRDLATGFPQNKWWQTHRRCHVFYHHTDISSVSK